MIYGLDADQVFTLSYVHNYTHLPFPTILCVSRQNSNRGFFIDEIELNKWQSSLGCVKWHMRILLFSRFVLVQYILSVRKSKKAAFPKVVIFINGWQGVVGKPQNGWIPILTPPNFWGFLESIILRIFLPWSMYYTTLLDGFGELVVRGCLVHREAGSRETKG